MTRYELFRCDRCGAESTDPIPRVEIAPLVGGFFHLCGSCVAELGRWMGLDWVGNSASIT